VIAMSRLYSMRFLEFIVSLQEQQTAADQVSENQCFTLNSAHG
jgi:hypothetical protein